MPLNTRAKQREPVPAQVELIMNESTVKAIKLNVPRASMVGDTLAIKAALIDISVSGCGIDSPYLIPPGVVLGMNIEVLSLMASEGGKDHRDPIKATARITSCVMKSAGHYRLGAFFTEISKEDIDLIDAFINKKEQRKDHRWDMTKQ